MAEARHLFAWPDYATCGALLLASLAVGLYHGLSGGRQRTSREYVLADRGMGPLPVTLSLLASYFSGVSVQGIPADVYFRGTMGVWAAVPVLLSGLLALWFFVPLYYNMGVVSVFEYLEVRFNKLVSTCGVFAFVFFAILYMGVVTFTVCVAATAVADVSFTTVAVCLVGLCAVYTVIGGMKAVLWTDTLQMIVILVTIVTVIIKGCSEMGGLSNVWGIAERGHRIQLLNVSPDPSEYYTVWGFVVGQLGSAATVHVTNQYMVQRYITCRSVAVARTSLVGFMVGSTVFTFLCALAGVTIYAYYATCDPMSTGLIKEQDEILPYFITEIFHGSPGVAGILLSGIFGAALSTLSSVLNGVAALTGEHLIKPCWKTMSDEKYTLFLKVIVVGFSFVTFGMAFLMPRIGSATPTMFAISGALNGPVLALYLLGAFYPRCSSKVAFLAYVTGAAVGVWLGVGNIIYGSASSIDLPLSTDDCPVLADNTTTTMTTAIRTGGYDNTTVAYLQGTTSAPEDSAPFFKPLYSVSRIWYPTLTCLLSILVGVVATLIIGGNDPGTVDAKLYVPISMCCSSVWPFRKQKRMIPLEEFQSTGKGSNVCEALMAENTIEGPTDGGRA